MAVATVFTEGFLTLPPIKCILVVLAAFFLRIGADYSFSIFSSSEEQL